MVETRSQQEQDLIAWASTLTKKDVDALTALMEQFLVTTPAGTLQLPEFSGLDHEDPQNFLELCEKGLATTNPALWRDKIATRLRGSAAEWWSHNAPFAPRYEDLKRAVVNKYGGPEIVIELHAQYYGTRQAVGESTDSFLSRKRRIAKRIFPNITEEKFIATCRFLVIDPSHLHEPPQPRHPADVVPHVPFADGPNQGHHQRPQHLPDPVPERAQGPADRQAPGGAYLDEKDAANDITAGDAAEVGVFLTAKHFVCTEHFNKKIVKEHFLFDHENDPVGRTLSPDAIPELNVKSCSNYLPPVSPVLNIKQYRNKKNSRGV
jgi:hypothetical protein